MLWRRLDALGDGAIQSRRHVDDLEVITFDWRSIALFWVLPASNVWRQGLLFQVFGSGGVSALLTISSLISLPGLRNPANRYN